MRCQQIAAGNAAQLGRLPTPVAQPAKVQRLGLTQVQHEEQRGSTNSKTPGRDEHADQHWVQVQVSGGHADLPQRLGRVLEARSVE